MTTRIHAIVATRWTRTVNRNDQEIANLVTQRANDSFSDVTGQPDSRIAVLAANVYLCDVDVAQATAAEINALAGVVVLASESYDDATPEVRTGNFDATPTAGQLTTFANQLKARFAGLTDAQLQRGGQAILRAGLTRRAIIDLLTQNFREF